MNNIQIKRGTYSRWLSTGTILNSGELGLDSTNNVIKIGNGSDTWVNLPIFNTNISGVFSASSGVFQNLEINDPLNAIVFSANDNFGLPILQINKSGIVNIDGNVGIGTTTPSTKLDVSGSGIISGDFTVGGNLIVNGTTITANVDTVTVEDPIITLGLSSGNVVPNLTYDRGLALVRGTGLTAFMGWDTSASEFVLLSSGVAGANSGTYTAGTYGDLRSNSFIKNGGNSSQFLKADGSVDSTTYVSSSDSTVVRTTGNQTISGFKTFDGGVSLGGSNDAIVLFGKTTYDLGINSVSYNYNDSATNAIVGRELLIGQHASDPSTNDPLMLFAGDTGAGVVKFFDTGSAYTVNRLLFDVSSVAYGQAGCANTTLRTTTTSNNSIIIDLPSTSGTLALISNINTSQITGVLASSKGGTGKSSYSNGQLLIGSGTSLASNTLTAGTGINITNGSGSITISVTGVSLSGHTHSSSNITDFNSSVSGLLAPYQLVLTNPVTGIGTSGYLTKWVSSSGVSNGIIYDNGSNIGIGTTTPSSQLHIVGTGIISSKLGIGTNSPSNSLEVAGGDVLFFPSDNSRQLNIFNSSYGLKAFLGLELFTDDIIRFRKGNTEYARIDTDGKLGIGTTTPSGQLHVIGSGIFSNNLIASGFIKSGGTNSQFLKADGSVDSESYVTNSDSTFVRTTGNQSVNGNKIFTDANAFNDIRIANNTTTDYTMITTLGNYDGGGGYPNDEMYIGPYNSINNIPMDNLNRFYAGASGVGIVNSYEGGNGYAATRLKFDVTRNDTPYTTILKTSVGNTTLTLPNISGTLALLSNISTTQITGVLSASKGGTGQSTYSNGVLLIGSGNSLASNILTAGTGISITNGSGTITINASGLQTTLTNPVTGTGLANHIAYWNSSSGIIADSEQLYWNPTNNKMGIGTSSPSTTLHVAGDITCNNIIPTDPGNTNMRLGSSSAYVDLIDNVNIGSQGEIALKYSIGNGGYVRITDVDSNTNALTVYNNNIGIRTTTPSGQLHVIGSGIISNRLGIGTNSPSVSLDVNGDVNIDGNLVFDSFTESVVAIGNSSTSKTISLTSGTVQTCTLTGNCTFTMPTPTAGKSFTLFLNTGAGNFTATFIGVRWADSATPTVTILASKVDLFSFISDGTYWYGSFSQNYG